MAEVEGASSKPPGETYSIAKAPEHSPIEPAPDLPRGPERAHYMQQMAALYGIDGHTHRMQMDTEFVELIQINDESLNIAVQRYVAKAPPNLPTIDPRHVTAQDVLVLQANGFYSPDARLSESIARVAASHAAACTALRAAQKAEADNDTPAADRALLEFKGQHNIAWGTQRDYAEEQLGSAHLKQSALKAGLVLAKATYWLASNGLMIGAGFLGAGTVTTLAAMGRAGLGMGALQAGVAGGERTLGLESWRDIGNDTAAPAADLAQTLKSTAGDLFRGVQWAGSAFTPHAANKALQEGGGTVAKWALQKLSGTAVTGFVVGAETRFLSYLGDKARHAALGDIDRPQLVDKEMLVAGLGSAWSNVVGTVLGREAFKSQGALSGNQVRTLINGAIETTTVVSEYLAAGHSLLDSMPMMINSAASALVSQRFQQAHQRSLSRVMPDNPVWSDVKPENPHQVQVRWVNAESDLKTNPKVVGKQLTPPADSPLPIGRQHDNGKPLMEGGSDALRTHGSHTILSDGSLRAWVMPEGARYTHTRPGVTLYPGANSMLHSRPGDPTNAPIADGLSHVDANGITPNGRRLTDHHLQQKYALQAMNSPSTSLSEKQHAFWLHDNPQVKDMDLWSIHPDMLGAVSNIAGARMPLRYFGPENERSHMANNQSLARGIQDVKIFKPDTKLAVISCGTVWLEQSDGSGLQTTAHLHDFPAARANLDLPGPYMKDPAFAGVHDPDNPMQGWVPHPDAPRLAGWTVEEVYRTPFEFESNGGPPRPFTMLSPVEHVENKARKAISQLNDLPDSERSAVLASTRNALKGVADKLDAIKDGQHELLQVTRREVADAKQRISALTVALAHAQSASVSVSVPSAFERPSQTFAPPQFGAGL